MSYVEHTIRPLLKKDLLPIKLLEEKIFDTDRLSLRSIKRFLSLKRHFFYGLFVEGQLAGMILILERQNSSKVRLYSLGVSPLYEGCGFAQLLLERGIEFYKKRKKTLLKLEVKKTNKRAITFYEKNQFLLNGKIPSYYQDGEEALLYFLKI